MNRLKVVIMVISTLLMPSTALTPVLAEIAKSFPDAQVTTVQLVMTLTAFMAFPSSLLSGGLAERFGKKRLVVGALFIMLLGGMLPLLFHKSMAFLLFSSIVIGTGMGAVSTLTPALIADNFEGDERGMLMGLQSSAVGLGATLLGLFSGQLARIEWQYAYLVFLVYLPVALVAIAMLPERHSLASSRKTKQRVHLNGYVWLYALFGLLICMFLMVYNTNIAMMIDSQGWGDSGSAGIASACYTGAIIVSGLLFGKLLQKVKQYILTAAAAIALAGITIVSVANSLPIAFLGGVFCGYSYAVVQSGGLFSVSQEVDEASSAMAIAIFSSACMVGNSLSPLFVTNLAALLGPTERIRFVFSAVCLLSVTALTLAGKRNIKKTCDRQ